MGWSSIMPRKKATLKDYSEMATGVRLSSHEKLRVNITNNLSIKNLVELPLSGFKGATVQICAFNIQISKNMRTINIKD